MKVLIICSFLVVLNLVYAAQFERTDALLPGCTYAPDDCQISELVKPCRDALEKGGPPTPECCAVAKKQLPCICIYKRCPLLYGSYYYNFIIQYFKGPNAYQTGKACGIEWPRYCQF